tara:strand:+ start:225 stop:1589 length:1365 start_codon:yes stop_codon:yes gene_type:complete
MSRRDLIMKISLITLSLTTCFLLITIPTVFANTNNLTLESVTKDVTYLASDELKGRASFSAEIDQAANYIAQRFRDMGLSPINAEQNTSFKQTFAIHSIRPKSLIVKINTKSVAKENLAMASSIGQLAWHKTNLDNGTVKKHVIGPEDNMRSVLSVLNKKGGQHLVLLHTDHTKNFNRYQSYFQRGLTKLSLDHQGAIIIVLTDDSHIDSLFVQAKTTTSLKSLTNVVAVLPGKTKPEEIVLYSSHYDHLGDNGQEEDEIYNGADDNASGTTAVINIAQYYANKADNARTLVFATFTAEEIGGFGSKYFSLQLDPIAITAMINIEMIGKPSKFGAGSVWMTGMERSNLGTLLNDNLKDKNRVIHQDPYPEQGLFYRSDNATLARLGVPAHSFSSTQLDKDKHYHEVSDDLASLDLNSMFKVIESLAFSTQGLVDGSVTPSRIDPAKVKKRGLIY